MLCQQDITEARDHAHTILMQQVQQVQRAQQGKAKVPRAPGTLTTNPLGIPDRLSHPFRLNKPATVDVAVQVPDAPLPADHVPASAVSVEEAPPAPKPKPQRSRTLARSQSIPADPESTAHDTVNRSRSSEAATGELSTDAASGETGPGKRKRTASTRFADFV